MLYLKYFSFWEFALLCALDFVGAFECAYFDFDFDKEGPSFWFEFVFRAGNEFILEFKFDIRYDASTLTGDAAFFECNFAFR